jgi:hypothetical protein
MAIGDIFERRAAAGEAELRPHLLSAPVGSALKSPLAVGESGDEVQTPTVLRFCGRWSQDRRFLALVGDFDHDLAGGDPYRQRAVAHFGLPLHRVEGIGRTAGVAYCVGNQLVNDQRAVGRHLGG